MPEPEKQAKCLLVAPHRTDCDGPAHPGDERFAISADAGTAAPRSAELFHILGAHAGAFALAFDAAIAAVVALVEDNRDRGDRQQQDEAESGQGSHFDVTDSVGRQVPPPP
jgi:hypothetical protein